SRFTISRTRQNAAKVSTAQLPQRKVTGVEVIDARLNVTDLAAHDVHFRRIERARACRRAKIEFAARIRLALGDSRRVVQDACKLREIRFISTYRLDAG